MKLEETLVYRVVFTRKAEKELLKLPQSVSKRIIPRIENLITDPKPSSSKRLVGYADLYRIRIGDYRVIYEIRNQKLIIVVIKIAHRKDIYKFLT